MARLAGSLLGDGGANISLADSFGSWGFLEGEKCCWCVLNSGFVFAASAPCGSLRDLVLPTPGVDGWVEREG